MYNYAKLRNDGETYEISLRPGINVKKKFLVKV